MKQKTSNIYVLSIGLIIGLLILSVVLTFSDSMLSQKKVGQDPVSLINEYVKLSNSSNFNGIENLISLPPNTFKQEPDIRTITSSQATAKEENIRITASDETTPNLNWIGKEFPETINKDRLDVKLIFEKKIVENQAKILIVLGNKDYVNTLPWAFLLYRKDSESDWKIFDITTPAQAQSYP